MYRKPSTEELEKFLTQVMIIQKRYAHELQSVKTERRSAMIELVNKFEPQPKESGRRDEAR